MHSFGQGFLLGLAYLAPIGTQNLYVINDALTRGFPRALRAAAVVALVDISLALACFYGMSQALIEIPGARAVLAWGGSGFLFYMGLRLLVRPHHPAGGAHQAPAPPKSLGGLFKDACAITWLNPQALVDGTVLLGGIQAQTTPHQGQVILLGVVCASCTWFGVLAVVLGTLGSRVDPRIWSAVHKLCGVGLVVFAVHLLRVYLQQG